MIPAGIGPVTAMSDAPSLNRDQIAILNHTQHVAARGLYCGGGKEMDALVTAGLMESAGRKPPVTDGYFRITSAGRDALRASRKAVQS